MTPDPGAGNIVANDNSLLLPFQVFFGGMPAAVSYAGLAPGMIGLYQFNVTVPNVPNGDAAVLATIGGVATQTGVLVTVQQ